jgi:predicted permease
MRTDLAFTLRALRHSPWYAGTIVGVTAVTMALATTVFAVVDGVLFRPLPFPDADRLVLVEPGFEGLEPLPLPAGLTAHYSASQVDLDAWRAAVPHVAFAGFDPSRWADLGPGVNDSTAGLARVQREFFDVIGVRPLHGGFSESDFTEIQPLRQPVIAIYDTWQRRFGGALDAIGRDVIIDPAIGFGLRIVGVMPRGFVFPSTRADIDFIAPLADNPKARTNPPPRSIGVVLARLPDGMSRAQLRDRLRPALEQTAAQFPIAPRPEGWSEAGWRTQGPYDMVEVVGLDVALERQSGAMFVGAFAAVMVLLVIAAANVSSLTTARAWERRRELDVRRALGAKPANIARIWLFEVAILLSAGAAMGAVVAGPLLTLSLDLLPEEVVLLKPARLDWRVAVFVTAAVVVLSALISIWPVRRSLRTLAGAAKGGTSERVRTPARFVVVGGQVAAAFVLTVLGACLVGSVLTVYSIPLPIATRDVQVVEARVQGEGRSNRPSEARTVRAERILERLRELPGVSGASLVMAQLLRGGGWSAPFSPPPGIRRLRTADSWAVMGDFFRVLDLRPIEGRLQTEAELRSGAPLIVVSEQVARSYWPDRSAIGQTLTEGYGKVPHTVIGVVPEVRWFAWDVESPMIYGPYRTLSRSALLTIFVRVDGAAAPKIEDTLRAVIETDPLVRPSVARPLDEMFRDSISLRRFQSWLFGGFAAAALAVMGVGILGLLAMSAARRTKEIGIRCALGATPRIVIRQLLGEQVGAVATGLVVGAANAAWAVQFIRGYLYQLSVADARIWAAAVVSIVIMALAGAFVPALRASRRDPLLALRAD